MKYDAIILGSGQAGNPLWDSLTDRGWTVALVEKAHLGGTCINYGCTPTKTMVASAQIAHYARNAARWGVRTGPVSVDLPRVVARKDAIVRQFRDGKQSQAESRANLHLYRGHARFVGRNKIAVDGQTLEAERVFINTGTRPSVPRIDGLDQVEFLTNATLLDLKTLPDHLLVLGGGYIGLEFGQIFRRFGSRVTIVHKDRQILNREDADVAGELQKALEAEGIRFILNARTTRVARKNGEVALSLEVPTGAETLSGTYLLLATGRTPNTDDLDLDKAGVETDRRGYIKVNDRLETNVPGIWALGDVKGGPAFTHISYDDYQIVAGNLLDGKKLSIEGRLVPYSVFTDPQLGRVGMTEQEARATRRRLKVGTIPMTWVARAIERDETAGLMKLVVDAETDRVLGAAILAAEGGELVHILETLMLAQAPYTLLKGSIYIHPTLAEGFFSLMEEVKAVE
jgi:pyruvate/2-oxoglutarate dehydrogenase complex dihydrolipoamide dehydrogenase (E3) component